MASSPSLATRALEGSGHRLTTERRWRPVCQKVPTSAGLNMLYARALSRFACVGWRDRGGVASLFGQPRWGRFFLSKARAVDLSRVHMDDNNPAAAIAVLQGVDHHRPATTWRGRCSMAVPQAPARGESQLAGYTAQPVCAGLCSALALLAQGMDACVGLKAPLLHTVPLRMEDAAAQMLALRFLGMG